MSLFLFLIKAIIILIISMPIGFATAWVLWNLVNVCKRTKGVS